MRSVELIKKERLRQIQDEGFSDEDDDKLTYGELALAGIAYASPVPIFRKMDYGTSIQFIDPFPWTGGIGDKRLDYTDVGQKVPYHDHLEFKYKLDLLVKGAALICAEIDKLLREQEKPIELISKYSSTND